MIKNISKIGKFVGKTAFSLVKSASDNAARAAGFAIGAGLVLSAIGYGNELNRNVKLCDQIADLKSQVADLQYQIQHGEEDGIDE